jgi:hypothetical protein
VVAGLILAFIIYNKIQVGQAEKEAELKEAQRIEIIRKNKEQSINNASAKQIEFERQRAQFYNEYLSAKNDIRKSQIYNEANSYSRKYAERHNFRFNNWYGTLKTIYTSQGGTNLFFEITSKLSDITISYKVNYYISPQSKIYNQIADLGEGDKVLFDFEFIPDSERGIVEASFSESGSLSAPEFNVFFHNVRSTNQGR